MDVFSLLYILLIGPIELFFEVLYSIAFRISGSPGLSIVFLSIAMNVLVLPLYRRADAVQEEQRQRAMAMKPWTDHIKKAFSGDERFMVMQAYNREMGYKPTDALKGSVSLLLEIPFFIAAYHFLSHLQLLNGVSFGPIADLGAPDALLNIGGVAVNALPILMTALNLLSAAIYMKGMPLSNKVQMIGIAAIFLVLLYNSPAGLVFYWTLNNLFSLAKNVFTRWGSLRPVLVALGAVSGAFLLAAGPYLYLNAGLRAKQALFLVALGAVLLVPLLASVLRRKNVSLPDVFKATHADSVSFTVGCFFMAILTGVFIPLAVIQASPTEFGGLASYSSPLGYVVESFALAVGLFVVWLNVFFYLSTPKGKTVFHAVLFILVVSSIAHYLAFGADYGNMAPELRYDAEPVITRFGELASIGVVLCVAAVLFVLWRFRRHLRAFYVCMTIAIVVMSGASVFGINQILDAANRSIAAAGDEHPHFTLSKTGKNVVMVMLDRAIPYFLPYFIYEDPALREQLAGFTFYPNTHSYGAWTNVSSPSLFGGYDYIPTALNKRSNELLADKQNEALKVLPRLFVGEGYDVTFFDPTYAGFADTPDLTVFDDIPEMHSFVTMDGKFAYIESGSERVDNLSTTRQGRNFFCYSLFRTAPLLLRTTIYDGGTYNSTSVQETYPQERDGASVSTGYDWQFVSNYGVLKAMPDMTELSEGTGGVLLMSNEITHAPCVLQEPSYEPAARIDNTQFDEMHRVRYRENGDHVDFPPESGDAHLSRIMHYQINMAAMQALGDWFDYLRENGVYDNTRIILVSDHGWKLSLREDLLIDTGEELRDVNQFNCLLMVKDFDAKEFTIDDSFMTSADAPGLAVEGLVADPVNPFTGNPMHPEGIENETHLVQFSSDHPTNRDEQRTTLAPGEWYSVHTDVSDRRNWEYLGVGAW